MVPSAVFSDLDVELLTVVDPPSVPRMTLAETVCRVPTPSAESRLGLFSAGETAAQQLINIVITLCSPEGGWPSDLPQTPDNLVPYVSEEVAELLDALSQAGAVPCPPPSSPRLQTRLLGDWLPQLLWQIASSGYEIMRLMEGIQARLYCEHDACASGIVRLVPVLTLTASEIELALDLVTQTLPQVDWLADSAGVQLAEGDLIGSLCPVETWIAKVIQQVAQQHPSLAELLHGGCSVEALVPGQGWCRGRLSLHFYLVMEEDVSLTRALPGVATAESAIAYPSSHSPILDNPIEPVEPLSEASTEVVLEHFTLDDFANILQAASDPKPTESTPERFTLDDFASSIEVPSIDSLDSVEPALLEQLPLDDRLGEAVVDRDEVTLDPVEHTNDFQGADEPLALLDMSYASALVLQPRFSAVVGDDLLSAWITLTDEDWIQTFLQTLAGEHFCQILNSSLAQADTLDQAEVLVQAAYDAIEPIRGADGLFKHTFVHQPVLLADLWPRLRWYLTRTSQTVMQMMGGVPVQWLSPGDPWQNGLLHLKLLAVLQLSDQVCYLDLANGQVLPTMPDPVPENTVVYPLTPELGQQPLGILEVAQQIDTQLEQVRSLTPLTRGVAIELHRLEAHSDDSTGRLHILWQLTLQSES
ncbi:MAG TPA: hypothetical protein V6D07_12765 [Trichocoleus sp.]